MKNKLLISADDKFSGVILFKATHCFLFHGLGFMFIIKAKANLSQNSNLNPSSELETLSHECCRFLITEGNSEVNSPFLSWG